MPRRRGKTPWRRRPPPPKQRPPAPDPPFFNRWAPHKVRCRCGQFIACAAGERKDHDGPCRAAAHLEAGFICKENPNEVEPV